MINLAVFIRCVNGSRKLISCRQSKIDQLGFIGIDSANESGKHAAAAIGQASGLPVPPVPIGTPRYPALLRPLHALGDRRFEAGKRNIFDVFFPLRPAEMLSTKRIHASKLFEPADHSIERADGR
jgi:hypothetical protein